jgi:hypothetical protein
MIDDTLNASSQTAMPRAHFTFEMYSPNSVSESGVPIMERVNVQFSGQELSVHDVLAKVQDFLVACGYVMHNKNVDLVG